MTKNHSVGVIFEDDFHYLDHLAPLCSLLEIPLLVTDCDLYELGKKLYPNLHISFVSLSDVGEILTKNFQKIYYCFTSDFLDQYLGIYQLYTPNSWEKIWCPHGYSEKDNYDGFAKEKKVLFYGKEMQTRLKEKNFSFSSHFLGNYRAYYFCKHINFYRNLLQDRLSFLEKKPTILYAPTWEDGENSFSFAKLNSLLEKLPFSFNWIIKLHPNTIKSNLIEIEQLKGKYEKNTIHFLEDFTPVYPLLDRVDGLMGDSSSICYDMLFFPQKPLFFFTENRLQIHKMGTKITEEDLQSFAILWEKCQIPNKHLEESKKDYYFSIFS